MNTLRRVFCLLINLRVCVTGYIEKLSDLINVIFKYAVEKLRGLEIRVTVDRAYLCSRILAKQFLFDFHLFFLRHISFPGTTWGSLLSDRLVIVTDEVVWVQCTYGESCNDLSGTINSYRDIPKERFVTTGIAIKLLQMSIWYVVSKSYGSWVDNRKSNIISNHNV